MSSHLNSPAVCNYMGGNLRKVVFGLRIKSMEFPPQSNQSIWLYHCLLSTDEVLCLIWHSLTNSTSYICVLTIHGLFFIIWHLEKPKLGGKVA